jgi:hypothetical protein
MSDRQHRYALDKSTIYQDGHRVLMLTGQHAGGSSPQSRQELRVRIVRLLNEAEGGAISDDPNYNAIPAAGWTCFHCGEHFPPTFGGQRAARAHFGPQPDDEPGCVMQLGSEDKRILQRLRWADDELTRYRAEDSDKDREMAGLRSDHARALIREEERGYAKGVQDSRKQFAETLRKHWLWQVECHHADKTDTSRCFCSLWVCQPQPSVGEAIERWVEHVLEHLDDAR